MLKMFLLLVFTGLCARMDMKTWKIPNELIAAGFATGVLVRFLTEGSYGMKNACLGLLLTGCIGYCLFRASMIGAGDLKLAMMTGFYLGPAGTAYVCLLGGLSCLVFLMIRDPRKNPAALLKMRHQRIPLAVMAAAGVLALIAVNLAITCYWKLYLI